VHSHEHGQNIPILVAFLGFLMVVYQLHRNENNIVDPEYNFRKVNVSKAIQASGFKKILPFCINLFII
jgi:hypothetical protein